MKTTGNEPKKEIVLLELFSGIGGFTKGFIDAGYTIKKHYFSEIDKHAIANYKYNFKDSIYVGSVTNVRGESIDRPDVITFGSPCQDFSLAGKERGWTDKEVALSSRQLGSLLKQNQVYLSGKMLKGLSPQMMVQTFGQLCKPLPTLGVIDLNGNCLIQGGFYPKIESEFTLLDILQEQVNSEYFLSEKMVKFLVKKANQTKTGFKPNVVPL